MAKLYHSKFIKAHAVIILSSVSLSIIGIIALYSISLHQERTLLSTSFFKQIIFLGSSLIIFFIIINIPRRLFHKYIYYLYLLSIIGIIIPFFSDPVAGTFRWITIYNFNFQPAEFSKWIVVLLLARFLSDRNLQFQQFSTIIIPFIIVFIPMLIILKQPDLGTGLIIITPVIPMLFWIGARPFHLFLIIAPLLSVLTAFHSVTFTIWAIVLGVVLYLYKTKILTSIVIYFINIFLGLLSPILWNVLKPYQQKRLLTLFNPELDPLGAAYQIIQSKTAIGSGGLIGKGLGLGTQTQLKFLPVQESDFILSVIGEEFGFLVILVIFILLAVMILRIVKLSYQSNDRFSSLTLIGIATIYLSQFFVNAAMTVGLIPVKGLPCPFISYGGSFLVSCFIMLGVVINFGVNRPD